jgi:hypothetical protein
MNVNNFPNFAMPIQGGNKDTWGTDLRNFFTEYFDLNTGQLQNVDDQNFNPLNIDGASSTPSLRTLGTGAQQACAGNDSRLSSGGGGQGINSLPASNTYPNNFTGSHITAFESDGLVNPLDCVIMDVSAGWVQANANAQSTTAGMCGIALVGAVTGGQNLDVLLPNSFVQYNSWSWEIGGDIYISQTSGLMTQTQPSSSGVYIRKVGYAVASNILYFNPSPDWLTHA